MIVANTKPGQLISIKNFLQVNEFYLITEKQDDPYKVRVYKQRTGFLYLSRTTKCKLITKELLNLK
tara:strand:- start:3525 stop:3722 length:198 start_codon:yes stop_codon:yes gene_type:complete